MTEPTKILIVSASPWNKESITSEEERSVIEDIFPNTDNSPYLVKYQSAAKIEDVHKRLMEFKPHILHFCGHGEEYGLYFLDNNGDAVLFKTEILLKLVTKASPVKIQCVILNACHTEKIAEDLVQHIEFVIGIHGPLNGMAAVHFSKGFYKALSTGQSIRNAFYNGCLAIRLARITNNQGVPRLKTKPFLKNYQVDILIHTNQANRNWADFFADELEDSLQRKLSNNTVLIKVTEKFDTELFKHSALCLFVLASNYSEPEQQTFASLEFNSASHFAIKSQSEDLNSENSPDFLKGLTPYSFNDEPTSHSYTEELLKLCEALIQRLKNLKEQSIPPASSDSRPLREDLVLIHPHVDNLEAGKILKPLIQQEGFACFAPDKETYSAIKTWQQNCAGVIIVDGVDSDWSCRTLGKYVSLQKRRKGKLRVVAIDAVGSKGQENCEVLNIYPSVPILKTPPEEELVNYVVHELLKTDSDKNRGQA